MRDVLILIDVLEKRKRMALQLSHDVVRSQPKVAYRVDIYTSKMVVGLVSWEIHELYCPTMFAFQED